MKTFGRTSVSEFLGDFIVYRNLIPADSRLPPLEAIRDKVGLPESVIPRKSQLEYARVVAHQLERARELTAPGLQLKRIALVGDTRMNDGTAFFNVCEAGGWPGLGFIGAENEKPPAVEMVDGGAGRALYMANRWGALHDFDRYCETQGFPIDAGTAVLIDMDKTMLGARGRNARVIDQVRVQAVRDTVARLLGKTFDEDAFRTAYAQLNQTEFHPFTADNQDYLAYICLILGSGLYELAEVVREVRAGQLSSFVQFIAQIDKLAGALPPALREIHAEIYANVQAGDPTPFKQFRNNEYYATIGQMGQMGDDASPAELLEGEIVITQEVRVLALEWAARGALIFGLSDKPDEASVPSPELAAQGYKPIHRVMTHAVGAG